MLSSESWHEDAPLRCAACHTLDEKRCASKRAAGSGIRSHRKEGRVAHDPGTAGVPFWEQVVLDCWPGLADGIQRTC